MNTDDQTLFPRWKVITGSLFGGLDSRSLLFCFPNVLLFACTLFSTRSVVGFFCFFFIPPICFTSYILDGKYNCCLSLYPLLCFFVCFFLSVMKKVLVFFCREVVKSKCGEGEATKALWLWLGKD